MIAKTSQFRKRHRAVMAAALGCLLAAGAQAQVDIHIAGAVSLKDVAFKTFSDLYGSDLVSLNTDNAAKPASANKLTFSGQMKSLFGTQTVTLSVNYNGSGAAIQSLTLGTPVLFLANATPGDTNQAGHSIDVGFSVVFQRDYPYQTPVLKDEVYGVTPTIFVKSPQAPASLTNLTSQHYRFIAANGAVPQYVFTGNTNDTDLIYWIMRDINAAHRIISAKEAGFSGSALAYVYNGDTWVLDPVGQPTWPAILTMLANNFGPCVSFVPPPEAASLNPENILSFNGYFPFRGTYSSVSNDFTPVITGQYTCWGYEHIMTRPNPAPNINAFAEALKAGLQTNMVSSPYSIPLSRMRVGRNATGGVVTAE
ncbi:MAG: hypothetical protein KIT22_03280 [Verrucomicrobiae bacterium]|nr:hypothetical protein [Verrucomicrobiae bacterium]